MEVLGSIPRGGTLFAPYEAEDLLVGFRESFWTFSIDEGALVRRFDGFPHSRWNYVTPTFVLRHTNRRFRQYDGMADYSFR